MATTSLTLGTNLSSGSSSLSPLAWDPAQLMASSRSRYLLRLTDTRPTTYLAPWSVLGSRCVLRSSVGAGGCSHRHTHARRVGGTIRGNDHLWIPPSLLCFGSLYCPGRRGWLSMFRSRASTLEKNM